MSHSDNTPTLNDTVEEQVNEQTISGNFETAPNTPNQVEVETVGDETSSTYTEDDSVAEENLLHSEFVSRVYSLPLIHDGVKTLNTLFSPYGKYTSFAWEKAETAVTTVTRLAEPYQATLQGPLSKFDAFGCHSLDILEQTFPIVTRPTSEIQETSRQFIDSYKAKLGGDVENVKKGLEAKLYTVVDGAREIKQMTEASQFLQRTTEQLEALNVKLADLMHRVKENANNVKDSSLDYLKEHNATLVSELEAAARNLRAQIAELPEKVQRQLQPLNSYFDHAYLEKLRQAELLTNPLAKAKEVLNMSADSIPLLQHSRAWLQQYSQILKDQLTKTRENLSQFTTRVANGGSCAVNQEVPTN